MGNLKTMSIKTYSQVIQLPTFEERFRYLKLTGRVGEDTFGFDRHINQRFYKSKEWLRIRDFVIVRDNGCDLGIRDREIQGRIIIHHMNPIRVNDIIDASDYLLNPEYLICISDITHKAVHYGDESLIISSSLVERTMNDTCPWRRG